PGRSAEPRGRAEQRLLPPEPIRPLADRRHRLVLVGGGRILHASSVAGPPFRNCSGRALLAFGKYEDRPPSSEGTAPASTGWPVAAAGRATRRWLAAAAQRWPSLPRPPDGSRHARESLS